MAKYIKVIQNQDKVDKDMRLKIKDIPIMNGKVIREIAALNDMNISQVDEIITFMGKYTANIISEGVMETVMLPYFGKFAPNIKMLQSSKKRMRDIKNKKYLLTLALKGKNINFVPQINPIIDETI